MISNVTFPEPQSPAGSNVHFLKPGGLSQLSGEYINTLTPVETPHENQSIDYLNNKDIRKYLKFLSLTFFNLANSKSVTHLPMPNANLNLPNMKSLSKKTRMQVIPGALDPSQAGAFSVTKIGQDETISDNFSMTPLYQMNKKNESISIQNSDRKSQNKQKELETGLEIARELKKREEE